MSCWRDTISAQSVAAVVCQQKVEERFHRNPNRPLSEDVARRVFLLVEGKVQLSYHMEDFATIPSKRLFIKPLPATESRRAEDFTSSNVRTFQVQTVASATPTPPPPLSGDSLCRLGLSQVEPSVKPLSRLALYWILQDLLKDENSATEHAKESRNEVTMAILVLKRHLCPGVNVGSLEDGTHLGESLKNE